MGYNQRRNTDNIYVRSITVGLINLLNNQIFYENVLGPEANQFEIVECPFFYSTTGDERYLQDFFLHWNDCDRPKKVDGNIDPIPRGVIQLTGMDIDTSALTQRWIRGEFTKVIDGRIETFNAYINSLPLNMTYEIEVRTDTMVDSFKIVQAVLETFYKVRVYNVDFRGFMIPCQVTFPEGYPIEKTMEFAYPSDNKVSFTFSLEIETYYPVIDEPNMGSAEGRELLSNGDGDITRKRLSEAEFDSILRRRRGTKSYPTEQGGDGDISDNLTGKTASIRHSSNTMSNIPNIGQGGSLSGNEYGGGSGQGGSLSGNEYGGGSGQGGGSGTVISGETGSQGGNAIGQQQITAQGGIVIEKFEHSVDLSTFRNPRLYLTAPTIDDIAYSKNVLELKWRFEGWLDKVNAYYSEDYGNTWVEFLRLYDARKESYFWTVPEFSPVIEALVISERRIIEQARIKLISDINGTIINYVILNPGQGYDDTVSIEIEEDGEGAILTPVVRNGRIESVVIINGGSGYLPSKETEIAIMIRSSANSDIFDTTKDEKGYLGVITVK